MCGQKTKQRKSALLSGNLFLKPAEQQGIGLRHPALVFHLFSARSFTSSNCTCRSLHGIIVADFRECSFFLYEGQENST